MVKSCTAHRKKAAAAAPLRTPTLPRCGGGTCRILQRILDARPAVRCHFSVLDLKKAFRPTAGTARRHSSPPCRDEIVLDRVFHDRLEHQARDAHRKHRFVNLAPGVSRSPSRSFANVQIGIDILQSSLCKRDLRTPVAADGCIKHG